MFSRLMRKALEMQFLQSPALPQILGCRIPPSRAWFDIKSSSTTGATPHLFEPCVPDRAVSQLTHPPGKNRALAATRLCELQCCVLEGCCHLLRISTTAARKREPLGFVLQRLPVPLAERSSPGCFAFGAGVGMGTASKGIPLLP